MEIILNKVKSPTWNYLKMNEYKAPSSVEIDALTPYKTYVKTKKNETLFRKIVYNPLKDTKALHEYHFYATSGSNLFLTLFAPLTSKTSGKSVKNIKLTLEAEKDATITLYKVFIVEKDCMLVDDTENTIMTNASVFIHNIFLTRAQFIQDNKTYLKGEKSAFLSTISYIGGEESVIDLNYTTNHYGKMTKSNLEVNGALFSNASKTFKGTIDFLKGSSGSIGEENERVLTLSPRIVNKSLPIILCSEEDVTGTHGATIGDIKESVLFYLMTRGISKDMATKLIAEGKLLSALNALEDDTNNFIHSYMNMKRFKIATSWIKKVTQTVKDNISSFSTL